MTTTDGAEIRELLRNREARGLRVPSIARLVLLTFALISVSVPLSGDTSGASPVLVALVFGTLIVALVVNVYLYVLLRRERQVEP